MVNREKQLYRRDITWNSKYHLLFIDQPVGTGYSYAATNKYVHELNDVSSILRFLAHRIFR